MRVGFIGLGNQGGPMARRIIDAGFPTTLWARRPETLDPYRSSGASIASSAADLGQGSDLVCICVVDDAGVEEVVQGEAGVLAGMGAGDVIAVHSTIHPDTYRRLAAVAGSQRVGLVDAPVSGGAAAAIAGNLLVMVGGDEAVVERCRPIFETYGEPVVRVGPLGSALVAKLVNNALMTAHLGIAHEALVLGEGLGLDRAALASVLQHGSGRSFALGLVAQFGGSLEPMRDHAGPLLRKDLDIVDALARAAKASPGSVLPLAELALRTMGHAPPEA